MADWLKGQYTAISVNFKVRKKPPLRTAFTFPCLTFPLGGLFMNSKTYHPGERKGWRTASPGTVIFAFSLSALLPDTGTFKCVATLTSVVPLPEIDPSALSTR
jgi:hypothetical protein